MVPSVEEVYYKENSRRLDTTFSLQKKKTKIQSINVVSNDLQN